MQGWGLFAAEQLAAGTFVCLYAGEYLDSSQADARLQQYEVDMCGHALLVRFLTITTIA
jgi:SET domain-containing protein